MACAHLPCIDRDICRVPITRHAKSASAPQCRATERSRWNSNGRVRTAPSRSPAKKSTHFPQSGVTGKPRSWQRIALCSGVDAYLLCKLIMRLYSILMYPLLGVDLRHLVSPDARIRWATSVGQMGCHLLRMVLIARDCLRPYTGTCPLS